MLTIEDLPLLKMTDLLCADTNAPGPILCLGLVADIFLNAASKLEYDIGIDKEDTMVDKTRSLMANYPDNFELRRRCSGSKSGKHKLSQVDA